MEFLLKVKFWASLDIFASVSTLGYKYLCIFYLLLNDGGGIRLGAFGLNFGLGGGL